MRRSSRLSRFTTLGLLCSSLGLAACSGDSSSSTVFEVVIENISPTPSFTAQDGTPVVTGFASGILVVHDEENPLFTIGQSDRGEGLESFAEDGNPTALIDSLSFKNGVSLIGLAQTASGDGTNVIAPGQSFKVLISADDSSDRLSVVLPFIQANDIIAGTSGEGVALFNSDGSPFSGDITAAFSLLDVGTEVNQAPGIGPDQIVRQAADNTGAAEGGLVRAVDDGFSYPAVAQSLRVTVNIVGEAE